MTDKPRLRTKLLFKLLLKFFRPEVVCDVGSMDGSEALWFSRLLPEARIELFEANPVNFQAIVTRFGVVQRKINLVNKAAWRENGPLSFFLENVEDTRGTGEHLRGISSTRSRSNPAESKGSVKVPVNAVRLDTHLDSLAPPPVTVALWIDVEGASFEVLEGVRNLGSRLLFLHLEVETLEFWKGQKLKPEVLALARSLGFEQLARGRTEEQHDVVLIHNALSAEHPFKLNIVLWLARLGSLNLRAVAACLRGRHV